MIRSTRLRLTARPGRAVQRAPAGHTGTFRGRVNRGDLVDERVIGPRLRLPGLLSLPPDMRRRADDAQDTAQQGHRVDSLLCGDELTDVAHRSPSLAKKAAVASPGDRGGMLVRSGDPLPQPLRDGARMGVKTVFAGRLFV